MADINKIQKEIECLSPEMLAQLREWFVRYDAETWDKQFESDVAQGKLAKLGDEALAALLKGKCSDL